MSESKNNKIFVYSSRIDMIKILENIDYEITYDLSNADLIIVDMLINYHKELIGLNKEIWIISCQSNMLKNIIHFKSWFDVISELHP